MTLDKIIASLRDIVRDRKSFLDGDAEHDEVFQADIAALEAAIQLIERQKWISVKDRLPVWSGLYLTCNMRSNYVPKVTVYRKSAQWFDEGNPTHWMPLPELPSARKRG